MPFSDDVISQAWNRSGGKCECERTTYHLSRCNKPLNFTRRGVESLDGWEALHTVPEEKGGSNTLANCEIVCIFCYSRILSKRH